MENKQFYLPNGSYNLISEKEFLDFYEKVYFYENRNLKLENEIDEILNGKKPVSENLVPIFRWKMGTDNYDDKTVTNRWGYVVDIEKVKSCLNSYDKDNPALLIEALRKSDESGPSLGSVYAFTVLYFVSGGKYPIYDKYAQMAVMAIKDGKKPGESVAFTNLPSSKNVQKIYNSYKNNFFTYIENIFGKGTYETDCKYDRALWAYGHLFYKENQ